jgi:1-acyl-sn-glycerol-3-phosphate acyltransferase
LLPATSRHSLQRRYARILLRCVGLRLKVVDRRDRRGYDGGLLVVAPHVSWTDVLVLTAVAPSGFVARADLLEWGMLGSLARRMRVIPIQRERLRRLPEVVDRIRERLHAGERVVVFPEGTTWCGRTYGGFRPALFEAAVTAECPVQPVGLRYLDHAGTPTSGPAFVGDESIVASMCRLVRSRGTEAEVVLAPLEWPGDDRRALAGRCQRAVRAQESTVPGHAVPRPGSAVTAPARIAVRPA